MQVHIRACLDVRGGEGGGAQRFLGLVHGPPARYAQHKGGLVGGGCASSDAEPASQRRWIPSLGYWKSSSTH